MTLRWIAVLLLALAPAGAGAETLDALLNKGPVVVVERDSKDRFSSATGIIAVNVSVEKAWATVIDFQRYTEFVPKVVKSDTEDVGPNERKVSWEIEVPGPNTKYTVMYHLDPSSHRITAEQIGGDLKGSHWSWWLEPVGPSRTLLHYTSSARHFSSILEGAEDDQQTITIGVNVGGTLALLRALQTRLQSGG